MTEKESLYALKSYSYKKKNNQRHRSRLVFWNDYSNNINRFSPPINQTEIRIKNEENRAIDDRKKEDLLEII